MSALLLVLLLYNLPGFLFDPSGLPRLLLLAVLGLALDAVAHFLIHKQPVCAVSAAVTALVLFTLSPGAPAAVQCLAVAAALVLGKLVWGGTGKNPLNPAMVGLALLAFITPAAYPPFTPSWLLLAAALLSLPFLLIRPYAGLGMMLGMAAALLLRRELSLPALMAWGVPLWGCLVITDPVTTPPRPVAGIVVGAAAGFIPMLTGSMSAALPLGVLLSNILSRQVDRMRLGKAENLKKTFGRGGRLRFSPVLTPFEDLSGETVPEGPALSPDCEMGLEPREILARIEENRITGCGGAAFPSARKLRTVMDAALSDKHLIVNAVECDPGLIHDKWLLTHRRDELRQGIALLLRCVPFKSVTVAAKDFYGAAFPPPVRLHKVRDYYPAGAEKLLIRDVLKIVLQPGEIPSELGILVLNAQTVASLCDAVLYNRKAGVRYITVADLNTMSGTVVKVRLGDSVGDTARRVYPNAVNVYIGGGAMSARLADDDAVIDEKTNFLGGGAVRGLREALCSRCGACTAYCPMELPVREISQFVDEGRGEEAAKLGPELCIECNLCSAVCPAGRDQAKRMRTAKRQLTS
jgi:ferredoxin